MEPCVRSPLISFDNWTIRGERTVSNYGLSLVIVDHAGVILGLVSARDTLGRKGTKSRRWVHDGFQF